MNKSDSKEFTALGIALERDNYKITWRAIAKGHTLYESNSKEELYRRRTLLRRVLMYE